MELSGPSNVFELAVLPPVAEGLTRLDGSTVPLANIVVFAPSVAGLGEV